ncbi:hypothetical protein LJC61_03345 [Ruminococcaceae bacterium OttesenSCG-928-A16]|nr:hypothetical protein [Ruminococcaceae bacterium OttesenSCG-928-A16]
MTKVDLMRLRVELTPPEPYFLGGERIFEIGDGNKHYFIRSLQTPPQTTLFGILRYLGISNPSPDMSFDADNIGKNSFHLLNATCDTPAFGKIQGISPLYLADSSDFYYIPTPFDHKVGEENRDGLEYEPFTDYIEDFLKTKKYPRDYTAKYGVADSWTCIAPGPNYKKTYKNLFGRDVRTRIDKINTKKAFVKKEHVYLKKGFSFVFFASVADDFNFVTERFVQPGFLAKVEKAGAEPMIPGDLLQPGMIYAQSDIYLSSEEANRLYSMCSFTCVQTKEFRGRTTNPEAKTVGERFKRYEQTATLIQSGSVFIPAEGQKENAVEILTGNAHARIAGFNHIVTGGTAL